MRACSVEGCDRKYLAKGYCEKHYVRVRKHGDPLKVLRVYEDNRQYRVGCTVNGCDVNHYARGYCRKHYYKSDFGVLSTKISNKKIRSRQCDTPSNDFTAEDWKKSLIHFHNSCAYCGCVDKKIHAEHIVPLSKGGPNTITNIIPACEFCNLSKHSRLIEVWYPKQSFYSKQRENKIYEWMGYEMHEDGLQATLF